MPFPAVTVCELGVADSEKSGGAFTDSVTVAVCDVLPLAPVAVRV